MYRTHFMSLTMFGSYWSSLKVKICSVNLSSFTALSRIIFVTAAKDNTDKMCRQWNLLHWSSKMDPCSVGSQLQASSDCHKTYFTSLTGFKTKQDLSSTDMVLLQHRTGITVSDNYTICFHHAKLYLDRYEDLQKSCCDPFNIHKKVARKNLHAIDIGDATFLSAKFGRQFVPGWKLCPKCTLILYGKGEVQSEDHRQRRLDSEVCIWDFLVWGFVFLLI